MSNLIQDFIKEEDGAAASEYAVLVALVVVAVVIAVRLFNLGDIYTTVSNKVKAAVNNQT